MRVRHLVAAALVFLLVSCGSEITPTANPVPPTATAADVTTDGPTATSATGASTATVAASTATSAPVAPTASATTAASTRPEAIDNAITSNKLEHDSRNVFYREPGGAQPTGGQVRLRIKSAENDLGSAKLRIWNSAEEREQILPMTFETTEPGADFWTITLDLPTTPTTLYYRFILSDGSKTTYYEDGLDRDGGLGTFWDKPPDYDYSINVYDSAWTIPDWVQDGVVYQIFPDRFNNGDQSNDRPGGTFIYGGQTVQHAWGEAPTGGNDFFGGDLEGVIQKLDYLQGLGVTMIYFNPIFMSPSNHRYDTTDYSKIDPALGDNETFARLVDEAKKRNIRIMLDGVFNHSSSDSIYFDKFGRYQSEGAAESQNSIYFPWFKFLNWPNSYQSWSGYDTLPQYTETAEVRDFLFKKPESVAQSWLGAGAAGWRLDAAEQKSHDFWTDFRTSVRTAYPDALIIGEYWQNASSWFLGDQWDGVMNYRFRDAVLAYLNGGSPVKINNALASIREDYPPNAVLSSMNILDSHDTIRALTSVGADKNKIRGMALLQFASPGMPTIYYGDEAGVEGGADPDDRRTYPWDSADQDLISYYSTLATARHNLSALRTGSFVTLATDSQRHLFVFMRQDDAGQAVVAFNTGDEEQSNIELDVAANIPDGTKFVDVLTNNTPYTVIGGKLTITVPDHWYALLVPEDVAAAVK